MTLRGVMMRTGPHLRDTCLRDISGSKHKHPGFACGVRLASLHSESAYRFRLVLPYSAYPHTLSHVHIYIPAQALNHVVGSHCCASGMSALFLVFRPRYRRWSPGVHLAGSRILHSACFSRRLVHLGACSFSGACECWSRASVKSYTSAAWGRGWSRSECVSASHLCSSAVPPRVQNSGPGPVLRTYIPGPGPACQPCWRFELFCIRPVVVALCVSSQVQAVFPRGST